MVRIIVIATALLSPVFGQEKLGDFEKQFHMVPDNALAVLVVQPAKMLETKSLAKNPLADLAGPTGLKPSDVEQLIAAIVPTGPPGYETNLLFVIELKKTISAEALKRVLSPGAKRLDDWPFPTFDGQGLPTGLSFALPRPKTLITSTDGGVFYGSLQLATAKLPLPKPKLKAMCGQQTGQDVFFAGEPDRLLHAMTFEGGQSGRVPEADKFFPSPAPRLVRGWFDLQRKPALTVSLTKGGKTEVTRFRDGVRAWKQLLLTKANLAADQLVKSKPALGKARRSFAKISGGISEALTDDGIRFNLDGSMKPVDAWWSIINSTSLYRAYQTQRLSRLRARQNMSTILLGIHNYHAVHRRWPDDIRDKEGNALLSWRVTLLPYVEHMGLYRQFKLDEPWDSPANRKLIASMPAVYGVPGEKSNGRTHLQQPRADGAKPIKSMSDFADGTVNTIALVPVSVPVPWTKPGDHRVRKEDDPWKGIRESGWFGLADGMAVAIDRALVGNNLFGAFTPAGKEEPIEVESNFRPNRNRTAFSSRLAVAGLSKQLIAALARGEQTAEQCISLLKSDDPFVIAAGLIGLEDLQYNWQDLRPMLDSRFEFVRHKAIVLMAKTEQPGVVSAIFNPGGSDQAAAWQCLHDTQLGKKHAAKELLPLLKHENRDYRLEAGFAVAMFGGKKYRSHVEALLKDPDEVVRKDAAQMLEIIDNAPE